MFGISRKAKEDTTGQTLHPLFYKEKVEDEMIEIAASKPEYILIKTKFYQTEHAQETIAIIEDPDGSISIGIARAGKDDDKNRRVSPEEGMRIAEGRAIKARITKVPLIKKNYLRGLHAMKVEI